MAEGNEQANFPSLRGSENGHTLVNADAVVRKCDHQERSIEPENEESAKLEDKMEELKNMVEKYREQNDWPLEANEESITSWTRSLVEENISLKERIEELLRKYKELKAECRCSVLREKFASRKCGANSDIRDSAEDACEELSKESQSMRVVIGNECTIPIKNNDVVMADKTARNDIDSTVVIGSRCSDAGKEEEQCVRIPEDTAHYSSYSTSEKKHGTSESSCNFIQSRVDLESSKTLEIERKASFAKRLVEENEELKRRMGMVCGDNDKLATECSILSERITYKANEVLMLEDQIEDMEGYIELLEGHIGESEDLNDVLTRHFSQAKWKNTHASSDENLLTWGSLKKSKEVQHSSLVEELEDIAMDGCDRRENLRSGKRMGVIIEEEEEEEMSLLNEGTSISNIILKDDSSAEEEILMEHETLASDPISQNTVPLLEMMCKESSLLCEKGVCHSRGNGELIAKGDATVKNIGFRKNDGFSMENYSAMPTIPSDNVKKACNTKNDNIEINCDSMGKRLCMKKTGIDTLASDATVKTDRGKGCTEKQGKKDYIDEDTLTKETQEDVSLTYGNELNDRFSEKGETRYAEDMQDVAKTRADVRGNDEKKHRKKNDKRESTPIGDKDSKEEVRGNLDKEKFILKKFTEQIWSIIGGRRQIEDVGVSSGEVYCDNNQVAKLSHAIWELKEENSDLYLKQYELKEIVGFLNADERLAQELNDLKGTGEELEEEKITVEKMCSELKDKCQWLHDENLYISSTCQSLQEEHILAEYLVKDLEQKCSQGEVFLTIEDEFRTLLQENSNFEVESKETVELQKKVNFWRGICWKLCLFLNKNNEKMAKGEEKCAKISKLAKRERSRRMRTERENKNMLKKDKIRSKMLCSRARVSKRMGEKMFDLELEIERLNCEIVNLEAERSGFEDSYKSESVLSSHLKSEVSVLESRVKLIEEALDRRNAEFRNLMLEKKLTFEELERARNVKIEYKKQVEELIEERKLITMEVQRQEGEIAEAKEKIEEKEMLLGMCRVELEKVIEKVKIEAENRQLLELSVKEEKEIRAIVEKRLNETVHKLNEATGRLEDAMLKNEELENAVEAQQEDLSVQSNRKLGIFRCWFKRRKRNSR